MEKAKTFVNGTLDSRISPMSYLFVSQNLITGIAFCFLHRLSEGVQNSILYKEGALIGVSLWGAVLLCGSLLAMCGMLAKSKSVVMIGAFVGWLAWVFASIVYLNNGNFFWLLPLSVVTVLGYGYLFLAASLGRLWDYTPHRR